jgi:ankyrin repeat protein
MRNSGQIIHTIEELISAIKENRDITEISQIISGIEDINQAAYRGSTALHYAAAGGYAEIVAQLLAVEGVDVNKTGEGGKTALYMAALNGCVEIVTQLLAVEGVDVNQADQHGKTALYWTALYGRVEIVAKLLAAGADVNQAPTSGFDAGRTALHWAALGGHAEIVTQLLAVGADVNQAPTSGFDAGRTALHWAALKGYTEIISHLLAYGADETLLTEAQQARYAESIAEGKAILIRNTKNSACALADTGRELQRVSIIQKHPCREQAESQAHENKLPELPESILAQIAAYATDLPRPNSLTQEQIKKCAEVGTECIEGTDMQEFFHYETKFVERDPGNTIQNILNGNQNPANGQGLGG